MAVTQRDVAAKAGVSKMVVSKVLHSRATTVRVSEATAERVRQVAEELGYRVNVVARNLRTQRSNAIGVLHGLGLNRPRIYHGSSYFAALVDGMIEGAFDHEYAVTICPKLYGSSPIDAMSDGRFDGLVWYSAVFSPASMGILSRSNVPIVLVHSRASDIDSRYPTILCDNDQGIGLALDHLVELGHTKIAFAREDGTRNPETNARIAAFHEHMKGHRLPTTERDILDFSWDVDVSPEEREKRIRITEDQHMRRGFALGTPDAMNSGWERWKSHCYITEGPRHTAVICNDDQLAARLLYLADLYNIRVPDELSVIGFDSTRYCDELRPRLTSVSQPLVEIGKRAIDLLVMRINGEETPPETVIPCGFDVRETTAPAL